MERCWETFLGAAGGFRDAGALFSVGKRQFTTSLSTFWHLHTPSKLFSGTPPLLPTVPAIRYPRIPLSQHHLSRVTVADSTKLLNCPRLPPPERCSNRGTVADVLQELDSNKILHLK